MEIIKINSSKAKRDVAKIVRRLKEEA